MDTLTAWRSIWLSLIGNDTKLVIKFGTEDVWAFDYVDFALYAILVIACVWLFTLAVHVFVDMWEK